MTYNDILADDTVIRIFLDTKTFIELSEKTGKMPPHSFMRLSQLNTNVANILIISVRKFKPTYWMLRKWTWHRVNILENARIAKYIVLSEGLRLYDSNLAQIYYLV